MRFVLALAIAGTVCAQSGGPRFASDGALEFPADYREWVYLSSGLGMNYDGGERADPPFENVFVTPAAYRAFLTSGKWPNGTMFALEIRSSQSKGSINRGGRFQNEIQAVEVEVKDEARYPGKWAFFAFGRGASPVQPLPVRADCYQCHSQRGAVDNTFVQFYPTLAGIAKAKGTYRAEAAEGEKR